MNVRLDWGYTGHGEPSLEYSRVLYAYLHPSSKEILYLGKADRCTVQERLYGKHKSQVFADIVAGTGLTQFHAIVGTLSAEHRFSSALLSDVETLLIMGIQPTYNRQARHSRTARPGLLVSCHGVWPHRYRRFNDA
jgi:hypothetical protein